VLLTQYCSGDKIQKNEIGGACRALWGRVEAYTGFWWGNLRKRDRLGDPGIDNIKMDIKEVGCAGMYWIELA
jgi:hypothetical protein